MIPTMTASAATPPITCGKMVFHVIVDNFHRTFSLDGPGGPSGIRLHHEMLFVARAQKSNFRDFDIRADSLEAAFVEIQQRLPGYTFLGTWTSPSIQRATAKK